MKKRPSRYQLAGKKIGRLTVIGLSGKIRQCLAWICKCDCGNTKRFPTARLVDGKTKSCGCLKRERIIKLSKLRATHKLTGSGVCRSWTGMIQRCYNPKCEKYPLYGARGISVCEFLRATPHNLKKIIGDREFFTISLDRKDNNGNYSCGQCAECLEKGWPKNVRWATVIQQQRNTRRNRNVTIEGETKCLSEWSEIANLGKSTIHQRLRLGWSGKRLLIPSRAKKFKGKLL
jgi:hypothetical protein